MISRILGQILGGAEKMEVMLENESCEELLESEDEDWIIINLPANSFEDLTVEDPLENLLIEHPSMSVYQWHHKRIQEEDDCNENVDSPRPVPVRRNVAQHLASYGDFLPLVQRARAYGERRSLSRSALQRQNLVRTRFCSSERRYGYFKQPSQRVYNY